MTEVMKALVGKALHHFVMHGEAEVIEKGIRAFIAEVEKRAAALAGGDPVDEFYVGHALRALTRELLGGDGAKE